jgi:hypothetical protein
VGQPDRLDITVCALQQGVEQPPELGDSDREYPAEGGWSVPAVAVLTVRNAFASMARVSHRYQESPPADWCRSESGEPFAGWGIP